MDHHLEVKHFSHQHPLTRFDPATAKPPAGCYGCGLPIEADGNPFYGCGDCDAFLHKTCLDLPLETHSPCHPPHPLTLEFSDRQHFCLVCCDPISGLSYGCSECNFYLNVRCHSFASSPEIVARKLEDGGHLFFLWETEPRTQYGCDGCGQHGHDTHLFQCMIPSCPRSFHFRCAPFSLPDVAKHEFHFHPLLLTREKFGEVEGREEYFCDACETERYIENPVYACAECGFASHVSCGIFKELPSIIAEYEKGSKSRGVSVHDVKIGNLSTEIQKIVWEEDELKYKLGQLTEKIEKLEVVRAQYVASKIGQVTLK